jgi:hypothetical protein
MTVVNNCTVSIKNVTDEAYTLGAVTGNPRAASAIDIKAGLDNLSIEASFADNLKSDLPMAVVHYLFHEYFALAHRTGLYNRQLRLWEMFSRVTSAQIKQLDRGFFAKTPIPVYEIVFSTGHGQNPVCALVIDKELCHTEAFKNNANMGKVYVELLRDFLLKVMKIQARLGANGVKGIFVVTPAPLEQALVAFIDKSTGANDPVSKAESIMPAPVSAHINLLTYESHPGEPVVINLAYPKVTRR